MKLTNLSKKDFEKILENYNIGKYKSNKHVWVALQNTVYVLFTTKGKFILKVFETSDPGFINYQVNIINYLEKKKIPVAKIMKTKKKENLVIYKKKRILIQEFVEGKELQKLNDNLVVEMGKILGKMTKELMKVRLTGKYVWVKDHEFKKIEYGSRKIKNFNFNKAEKEYLKEAMTLKRKKLRRGVIHGDACEANLLVRNNKLKAIIDWDDAHEDYIVLEVAVFFPHLLVSSKGIREKEVKVFMKEYQKILKLNKEEEKALFYFIKYRYLGAIAWCAKQQKIHKEKNKEIGRWVSSLVDKYKAFNKLSLENFLEMIK